MQRDGAVGPRPFYRLVTSLDPPLSDFTTYAAKDRVFADPEAQKRAAELSVWETLEQVRALAERRPWLGDFVAELEVPLDASIVRGRRGHWGIRGATPAQVKTWVVRVVPIFDVRDKT